MHYQAVKNDMLYAMAKNYEESELAALLCWLTLPFGEREAKQILNRLEAELGLVLH